MQQNQSLEQKELKIMQALAVCAELTNTQLSPAAMDVMTEDLMAYPLPDVLTALQRCRRELSSRLTLAEVLARLPNQLPSADEAWALVFDQWHNEAVTIVLPEIAQLAAGESHAFVLLDQREKTAARMAFKAAYEKLRGEALASGMPHKWTVSAGNDPVNRECVLLQAVKDRKLTRNEAAYYLPSSAAETRSLLAIGVDVVLIAEKKVKPAGNEAGRAKVAELLAMLNEKNKSKLNNTAAENAKRHAEFQAKKAEAVAMLLKANNTTQAARK